VGVGLPRTKAEAQLRATELAMKGYNTYVREGYFVQVGSYSKEANAQSELLKLQAAGIPDASMMTFVE
jgi:cell division protein FtsN